MIGSKDVVSLLSLGFLFALLGACAPAADSVEDAGVGGEEAGTADEAGMVALWEAVVGIETPESAYLDADSGFIFVSQVAGEPDGRDGNGRIVQLSAGGEVVSEAWFEGLNAPKGLRSYEGVLWTADIDEVIAIDIASREIVSRITIEGAQFLNDVAVGDDGTVYVSDMAATTIYALSDGQVEVFAEGEDLEWPNGLLVDGDRLIVGGWGRPEADFSTLVPGRLFALDLETKEKTLITPDPLGNIDGVESDGRGGWILTDYLAGRVMHVTADGEVRDLGMFEPGTADLGFIPDQGIAIVPHMNENRVVAYDVSGLLE